MQIAVDGPGVEQSFIFFVDQDGRRREGFQQMLRGKILEIDAGCHSPEGGSDSRGQALSDHGARTKIDVARTACAEMAVDPLLLVERFEALRELANRLGPAEKKHASRTQSEMKQRKDLLLGAGPQIDQKVPAGNEIEPRERRVGEQVLDREHHGFAQIAHHPVSFAFPRKKPGQALLAHSSRGFRSIKARAGKRDGMGIDIGRKDLKLDVVLRSLDRFQKKHGERIDFLAGAAAGHPNAQRPVERLFLDHIRDNACRKRLECGGDRERTRLH